MQISDSLKKGKKKLKSSLLKSEASLVLTARR